MYYDIFNTQKGFTLIELLIVIVIVGTLASIAMPNLMGITEKARIEAITFNARTLVTEMEVYKFENDNYPDAANAENLINNYSNQLNALNSIVQEVGTENYNKYHYETNTENPDYVFSVELPNDDYVGISAEEGLKEELSGHLSLE